MSHVWPGPLYDPLSKHVQCRVQSHLASLVSLPLLSAVSGLVGGLSTVDWYLPVYCFVNLEGGKNVPKQVKF